MRILVNNNYIKVVCPGCKSELGVHKEDIRYNEIQHHCSEFDTTCGACGVRVPIPSGDIPRNWLHTIVPDDL